MNVLWFQAGSGPGSDLCRCDRLEDARAKITFKNQTYEILALHGQMFRYLHAGMKIP